MGFTCQYGHNACPPTAPPVLPPASPNETELILIYADSHYTDLVDPLIQNPPYTTTMIENEIRRTIAHEVGHGLHVCHRGDCGPELDDSAIPESVMDTATVGGPPATDPRSQYNSFDVGQIRLHTRSPQ